MSCSSTPFPFAGSSGRSRVNVATYSTIPRALRGASMMSLISALRRSVGSTSPYARPMIFSYCPTAPNRRPPNAVCRDTISMRTIFAPASRAVASSSAAPIITVRTTRDAGRVTRDAGRRRTCSIIGRLLHAVGDRHAQQRRAERLAVRVEREGARHPAAQRVLEHEVERAEPRQLVAHDVALHDAVEVR